MWRLKPSKFKNAMPKVPKKPEGWVTDISVGSPNSPGNCIHASAAFVAFNIELRGGGSLGILRLNDFGSKRNDLSHLNAHSGFITSFEFCRYDDGILATGSQDHHVKLWRIPYSVGIQEMPENAMIDLLLDNAVEAVCFHPLTDSVLTTADAQKILLWDVNSKKQIYESFHDDLVQGLSWKADGQLLASCGRDKKLRIWDPRNPLQSQVIISHASNRDTRVLWLGDTVHVLTSGFGTGREREVIIRDVRNLNSPVFSYTGESSPGVLIPLFDSDTNMLFMVAKADTAVSFWEVTDRIPFLQEVSKYVGNTQAKGAALVPKRGLKVMEGEVNRILILGPDCIAPVPYVVPRKSYRDFHCDLFPDTALPEPTTTVLQWISGENIPCGTMSLNPSLHGNKPYFKFDHQFGVQSQNAQLVMEKVVPGLESQNAQLLVEKEVPTKYLNNKYSAESMLPSNAKLEVKCDENPDCEALQKDTKTPKPASSETMEKDIPLKFAENINVETDLLLSFTDDENKNDSPKPNSQPSPQRPTISFGIRASKFRHLNGTVLSNETHITDISSLTRTIPGESEGFHANKEYVALPLGTGGGLIAIIPLLTRGRAQSLADVPGVICGTKCLDFMWDPFDSNRLVTACDSGDIQIWIVEKNHLTQKRSQPDFILKAITDKVNILKFHPCARDVLCSAGGDFLIRIWDLSSMEVRFCLEGHDDQILALAWSPDGQCLATVSKDQKIRIYDPRLSPQPIKTGKGPEGIRGARLVWVLNGTHLVVSGFNKVSERQLYLYHLEDPTDPVGNFGLDVSPATLIPYYDEDSSTLFVTGKGDSTVYAFEVAADPPFFYPLSHYKCSGPHQALSFLPKILCNVKEVEFARALRLTTASIETLSFYVPRLRTEYFQDDIYPDTRISWEPTMSSADWFSGLNKPAKFMSLKPEDMISLSEAPAPIKSVSHKPADEVPVPIAFEGDVVLQGSLAFLQSNKEKEDMIVQSMMSQCQFQQNSLPQDSFDGVDPEEWDEEENAHSEQNQ